jgi:hypothetical protein
MRPPDRWLNSSSTLDNLWTLIVYFGNMAEQCRGDDCTCHKIFSVNRPTNEAVWLRTYNDCSQTCQVAIRFDYINHKIILILLSLVITCFFCFICWNWSLLELGMWPVIHIDKPYDGWLQKHNLRRLVLHIAALCTNRPNGATIIRLTFIQNTKDWLILKKQLSAV